MRSPWEGRSGASWLYAGVQLNQDLQGSWGLCRPREGRVPRFPSELQGTVLVHERVGSSLLSNVILCAPLEEKALVRAGLALTARDPHGEKPRPMSK